MHVCSLVSHVDDQSFACSVKQEDKRALCEIWYDCDFPLFFLLPVVTWLSCREILIWSGVCSFCLSSPISLTHSCPFPPISISPTSLFLCQAAGITQMALAQARMLIWEKDACCEFFFIVERKHFLCFYLPHSIIAHWNLFFKLWKLLVPTNYFGSVYRFLSVLNTEGTLTDSFIRTLCRLLCGIWQGACCFVD